MATQETKGEKQIKPVPGQGILGRRRGLELFPSGGELFLMNPFSLMRKITDEMNRTFGEFGRGGVWSPPIEVSQQEGKLMISAELPGVKPEEVTITVDENTLVMEGERSEKKEEETAGIRRSELRYGRFYRAIPLPEGASPDQAKARFEHGVLRIEIPVAEESVSRKKIPIEGMAPEAKKVEPAKEEPAGGKKAA